MIQDIRRYLRHIAGPLVGVSAVVYFAYHTVEGDRGIRAWLRLQDEIVGAEQQLAKVSSERRDMEHRVLLLRPDHLDQDMLEERARIMLNMSKDGDIVVFDRRH